VGVPDEPNPAKPHKKSWQHPAADLDVFRLTSERAGVFDDNEKVRSGKRRSIFVPIVFLIHPLEKK
jgi:hypothetical protein